VERSRHAQCLPVLQYFSEADGKNYTLHPYDMNQMSSRYLYQSVAIMQRTGPQPSPTITTGMLSTINQFACYPRRFAIIVA
jgi:hypothetical protein